MWGFLSGHLGSLGSRCEHGGERTEFYGRYNLWREEECGALSRGAGPAPVEGEKGERKMVELEGQAGVQVQGSLAASREFQCEDFLQGSPVLGRTAWPWLPALSDCGPEEGRVAGTCFSLLYSFNRRLQLGVCARC